MTGRYSISEFGDVYEDDVEAAGKASSDADQDLGQALLDETLGSVPCRELVVVDVGVTVAEAIQTMRDKHVGYVVVARDQKLAGIFTERDVLTKVADGAVDAAKTNVSEVMTKDPDTLSKSSSVAFALHRMSIEGYRHIPLVDDENHPVGLVAVRDIIAWMVDHFPDSVLNLPPDARYPSSVDGG